MSLATEMGYNAPENQVFLPNNRYRRIFDRDFTIREVKCECGEILCALVIAEEHEADLVWPFDVICLHGSHILTKKGHPNAAKISCYGRAAQEWEAKEYLKSFIKEQV